VGEPQECTGCHHGACADWQQHCKGDPA
jgi:hypothetical protein